LAISASGKHTGHEGAVPVRPVLQATEVLRPLVGLVQASLMKIGMLNSDGAVEKAYNNLGLTPGARHQRLQPRRANRG